MRALHCKPDVLRRRWQLGAHVKRHLYVRPEPSLRIDGVLGSQANLRSVIHRSKRDTVVVHSGLGRAAAVRATRARPATKRHHLKAARVGEEMAAPARKALEAAECGNGFHTRTQHEVVGVRQHDLETQRFVVTGVEMDDDASGSHRHEHRRLERAPRRGHLTSPSRVVGGEQLEADRRARRRRWTAHARSLRSRNMASPNDRKR